MRVIHIAVAALSLIGMGVLIGYFTAAAGATQTQAPRLSEAQYNAALPPMCIRIRAGVCR